jgi:RHS repeat-associated protein
LVNHLQNVLVTVSDKKIQVDDGSYTYSTVTGYTKVNSTPDGIIDYYKPDIITANDYYPGGMIMPGRKYTAGSKYRYGFGGKEKDNEDYGEGNAYDYGARIYNPRLVRWLSVDPLQQKYTDLSPYQYCANSPIAAKDPDGRVIIFINGLWTPGTSVGAPLEPYWNTGSDLNWVRHVQDRIGDHAQPRFYDGALGGSLSLLKDNPKRNPMFASTRIAAGEAAGYRDAAAIIGGLDKGETIKIVTNSMGTAFARGFTKGILKYQAEENAQRTTFNAGVDKILAPLKEQQDFLIEMAKTSKFMSKKSNEKLANDLNAINSKISDLSARKKELLNVQFESETDLSSHQIDYANPDVKDNYFMTTNNFSTLEKRFVDQRSIKDAMNLGKMGGHHSSWADPADLMPSNTADPKPPIKKE